MSSEPSDENPSEQTLPVSRPVDCVLSSVQFLSRIIAMLSIATQALVTGALHEDGLADIADGFGGGATSKRKLEIMKDSSVGAFGAVAVVLRSFKPARYITFHRDCGLYRSPNRSTRRASLVLAKPSSSESRWPIKRIWHTIQTIDTNSFVNRWQQSSLTSNRRSFNFLPRHFNHAYHFAVGWFSQTVH